MKVFIADKYHHKNQWFLEIFFKEYITNSIKDADVIFSAHTYFNTENFKDKLFIFGPHFSIFPNNIVRKISNKYNNSIYIQPSQPSVDTWVNEFNFKNIPVKAIPFGVNTDKFKQVKESNIRTEVIVYYKSRDPRELKLLINFLSSKHVNYKLFSYEKKYKENDYLNSLQNCKYMIVLGRHESQGFAIEEAMSCNVPLLVWSVKLRNKQYPYRKDFQNVKTNVTTIPYWDSRCGEFFYEKEELDSTFNRFISKLKTYKPREYILENLSVEKCGEKFLQLIKDFSPL